MTESEIKEVEKINQIIEKVISVDASVWYRQPPKFEKKNKIYGKKVKTIWLQFDGFEIGVYPFAGAIVFGVSIFGKVFFEETNMPIPVRYDSYFSKHLRWIIKQIIAKIHSEVNGN